MHMRRWKFAGYSAWVVMSIASGPLRAQTNAPKAPVVLVREVVYNELHDHDHHGYWRYWIRQGSTVADQVETADGPLKRVVSRSGHLLDAPDQQREDDRINKILNSPGDQARLRQEYADDEKRIGRILALLPDAFLFEYAGEENGCHHLRFRPNPNYPAHSIEARVFHAMNGDLWIDARYKRLARLDGQLQENVDFGYGILGRLYKGGWFRLQRTRVSENDWKTERLEMHLSGRALLLKTIDHETSETRGGFAPVPPGLTLAHGMKLLVPLPATASVSPASFLTQP